MAPKVGAPRRDRKTEIVDAAARLFAAKGYHATSIQDLVDATGLQRGALYYHIETKKDLLFEIHRRFIDPLLEESRRIDAENLSAEATLRALAHSLMRDIERYRDEVTVFLHEWSTIRDDPEWQAVRESRREFESLIERVLRRGIADGSFALPDVQLAKLAFLGMLNYTYQWFAIGGRSTPDEIADCFTTIFLHGISR